MGVETISTMLSAGPYRWAAHDLTAVGVATNRVSAGAYRAPGAPPAAFAVESLMDRRGGRAGPRPDRACGCRTCWSAGDVGLDGQEIKVFGARECLERVQEHPLWQRRGALPEGEGVGVALGFWPGGLEPAAAICKLDSDGKLTVVTAAADMSGIENAFIAIAAETFGLAEDSVRVVTGDTSSAPYGGVAGGSKVTYTYGRAIERAAAEARERLLRRRRRPSSRSRPRTSSSSTARCARSARRAAASRSPTWRPRRTRSAARTSRSRATAASRRSAARPAPRRTSRTCAWTARPAA